METTNRLHLNITKLKDARTTVIGSFGHDAQRSAGGPSRPPLRVTVIRERKSSGGIHHFILDSSLFLVIKLRTTTRTYGPIFVKKGGLGYLTAVPE